MWYIIISCVVCLTIGFVVGFKFAALCLKKIIDEISVDNTKENQT